MAGLDSNTLLLLHMDNAGLSDSSSYSRVITVAGTAARSSTQSKFGGYSCVLDGDSDYLTAPDSADWSFSSFTVDCWIYLPTLPAFGTGYAIYSQDKDSTHFLSLDIIHSADHKMYMHVHGYNGSEYEKICDIDAVLTATTWHHLAFVKNGNDWLMFFNGSQVGTTYTNATAVGDLTSAIQIGRFLYAGTPYYYLNGYIDELRISKTARWTTNFTPPTSAYSLDGGQMTTNSKFWGT